MNFDKVEQVVNKAREDFESIIFNTTLDLEARWDLFSKAPIYLKSKESWIIDIPGIDRNHSLFSAEYRCSEINIIDRVNDWFSEWEWNNSCPPEERCDDSDLIPLEEIRIIKEWALANNTYAFNFDW